MININGAKMSVGDKYNKLLLIKDLGMILHGNQKRKRWGVFKCDCGNEKEIVVTYVKSGVTVSCGCHLKEIQTTHGLKNHYLYHIWNSMRMRCINSNDMSYKDYGGRGIEVCNEWDYFINFYNWSISNGWKDGLQIDRIDNDGNYEPDNCQWVTRAENYAVGKRRMPSTNKSGYTGVHWDKRGDRWVVTIKSKYIKGFKDIDDAVKCRINAEIEMFGEQKTNFHYNCQT